jgi:acetyltransferase-like isoleucine patch superfamily enzyme
MFFITISNTRWELMKYLKWTYLISFIRLGFLKLFHISSLKLSGIRYFIGKGVSIETKNNSGITFGDKVFISDYCHFHSSGEGLIIGFNTFLNRECKLVSMGKIEIGENCLFGPNVGVYDHDHRFSEPGQLICKQGMSIGSVKIGSDVWIGANTVITKGATIGDHVVVGANSVVTGNLESNGLYAGSPARFIRKI